MEIILIVLIFSLLILGFIEFRIHLANLSKIPIRIHVNGSRGKSSVVRLIAAGLRAGGMKTIGKTTGTSPRIIDEHGNDKYIHRLRSASIGEQISLIRRFSKLKPDALVIECMAVNPQYQWISEHRIVKSTIGVLTNVRPDHLDEMGISIDQITKSMGNTIPFNGIMVSSEDKQSHILKNISLKQNTKFYSCDLNTLKNTEIEDFQYLEHKENISLAIKVCELCGVDRNTALKGMGKCNPDPGALSMWKIKYRNQGFEFINAFAANDPASTLKTWNMINERLNRNKIAIFLNTRLDRQYRTIQLINLIFDKLKPDVLILRGENFPSELKTLSEKNKKITIYKFPYSIKQKDLIKFMDDNLADFIVLGIGNIVGWGEVLMKELKELKVD
tara:strand:- start:12154 stop:13317 length:1164 start_codon:yes stop_codon:yes gene_type:complete